MARLLLLQVGHTFEHVRRARGDYDAWFRAALGPAELTVVRPGDGDGLPEGYDYAGIVVSGSAAMVTDREPWSVETATYLREAVERAVPVLGVCYGHQLLADAFGGEVQNNPRGRRTGTVALTLTAAAGVCPLFSTLPAQPFVQVSHRQSVLRLPEGAVCLASAPHDPHHAFRIGERTWGVQFHPEFDAAIAREYIVSRRDLIASEGDDPEQLLAEVRECETGKLLLGRFAELVR